MAKFHFWDLVRDFFTAQNLVVDQAAEQVAIMEFGHYKLFNV